MQAIDAQRNGEVIRWVPTDDGHVIAAHYYAPLEDRGYLPVMMLHGLGINRHNFDMFGDPNALPRQMARAGYHVYVVELRGIGMSRQEAARSSAQGIDAYLRHDLPALVGWIRKTHRVPALHWIGHSMGAILGYLYNATFPGQVQSLVAAAGPVPAFVRLPARRFWLPVRHLFRGGRMGHLEIPSRLGLHAVRRMPRLVRLAYHRVLFHADNMPSAQLVKFAEHAVENIPLSVLRRLGEWVMPTGPYAGEIERALQALRVPTLFMAATYDPLCTPETLRRAAALVPAGFAETVIVSRATGFGADFGHGDLLASSTAVHAVYPAIMRFVDTHEAMRAPPALAG